MNMESGCLYHIKDEFFNIIKDRSLSLNHDIGHSRPTYFVVKDQNILWFIPLSSKVEKYKKVVETKVQKHGICKTIMIIKIANKECAVLLQNAFPTLEKFIDHAHLINGKVVRVRPSVRDEILENFKYMMKLKNKGINLFYTNIDNIMKQLEKEFINE